MKLNGTTGVPGTSYTLIRVCAEILSAHELTSSKSTANLHGRGAQYENKWELQGHPRPRPHRNRDKLNQLMFYSC
jgi:hypothetical protein